MAIWGVGRSGPRRWPYEEMNTVGKSFSMLLVWFVFTKRSSSGGGGVVIADRGCAEMVDNRNRPLLVK